MKLIFLSLIALLIAFNASSQKPNEDLSQVIKELRNDIKELEAEIADAKINAPDDVPDLESELAPMKKMLASFEKMAGVSSSPQPSAVNTAFLTKPVNNSTIVPIVLDQLVNVPTPDQATDRLLWYTGKKINDSTLITTRAMVVQHQTSKNRVVAQPDAINDPFKSLAEELKKTEQRKDELIDKILSLKNGVLYYPQLSGAIEYYDDFNLRYNGVIKNTIDIPEIDLNQNRNSGLPLNSQRSGLNFYDPKLEEMEILINEISVNEFSNTSFDDLPNSRDVKIVLQEALAKFKSLPNPEDFPSPPEHELNICGSCDKKIVDKERKADSIWVKDYSGKEQEIMRTVLGVYRQVDLLGVEVDETDPGIWACNDAIASIFNRMDQKNAILLKKYGKDLKRSQLIAQTVLGNERQEQLLGYEREELEGGILGLMNKSDAAYLSYFNEQLGLKNYNFVFNFAGHLGRERQRQLLGITESGDAESEYYWNNVVEKAIDFNRFALQLDLDFVFEKVDDEDKLELRATGSINSEEKVYVSLYRDGCSWRMLLAEADYNNASEQLAGIPLKAKTGVKTIRDKDDNLISFPYSGPEDMMAFFPEFKINLCDVSQSDSAFMMPINFPYGYIPQVTRDLNKSYKDEMLPIANHIFLDLEEMEENTIAGMDLAADVIATLSESNVTNPTGKAKLDKMQMEYNIKLKQDAYKKDISQLGMNKKSVFLFNANNGYDVFIDQTNDTKHQIDDYTKLVKGQIHLKVVHDPREE